MKAYQLSTNLTIALRVFLPTFWLVFFGLIAITVWLVEDLYVGTFDPFYFKIGTLVFFVLGLLFFYFSSFKIYRADVKGEELFISNYIKTVKYNFESIAKITERDWLFFKTIKIQLHQKGRFGRKFIFIPSKSRFEKFLIDHPTFVKRFLDRD